MNWTKPGDISTGTVGRALLVAASLLAFAPNARAQTYERPPADIEERGYGSPGADSSSVLRIDRLENQVRSLNGQVEQLQFQLKRMEDQLRKFQMDVDSRLQDSRGGKPGAPLPRRSELPESPPIGAPQQQVADVPPIGAAYPPAAAPAASVGADGRRHDAFDPGAQPAAPGAPQALGSPDSASRPVARPDPRGAVGGPLDLTPPGLRDQTPPQPVAAAATIMPLEPAASPASPADPIKAEYDAAADALKAQRYDAAQQGFAAFVQKNPHHRLIAPAVFHLGESFYYQNRHREAAEQFLKIAQDYAKSPVAPSAMIKLGVSLNALGAKEQACAFFSEMPRKYPNAAASEKLAAAREAKKASC